MALLCDEDNTKSEASVRRCREAKCSAALSWLQLSGVPHTPIMCSSCMLIAHRSVWCVFDHIGFMSHEIPVRSTARRNTVVSV